MLEGADIIGLRVDVEGQLGTIRFHGSISPSLTLPPTSSRSKPDTLWYGIEWDDPSRGKHSGTHNGIKYFITKHPNAGSFIKPSSKIKFGRSYLAAVQTKYIFNDEDELANMGDWGGKVVEAIGWEKIKRKQKTLSWLQEVNVSGLQISGIGNDTEEAVRESSKSLWELDMSRNLFRTISEVGVLTRCMSKLEVLRLNYCRLELDIDRLRVDSFRSIKVLVLNSVDWSWKQMGVLSAFLPALEDLSFAFQPYLTKLIDGSDPNCSITYSHSHHSGQGNG
ncbi:hypothetical protein SeLEV6574_g06383, partial [Synchytrium endobioticum]